MNIYLIGMPGVGKTTIGNELAKKINYDFIDTDDLIKKQSSESIEILLKNEKKFRMIESNVIKSIRPISNTVVSLGGGAILNKGNIDNFYGVIIYLKLDINTLKARVDISTRPLLKNQDINKVFQKRKNLYEQYSDYQIVNNDIDNTINTIIEIINKPKKKILVINGPNLNLLGKRDVNHYGTKDLEEINLMIKSYDFFNYSFYQSNVEGEIVNEIQKLDSYDALIINPAAYTHTSVAIRDALEIFNKEKVEVHLSNINSREKYRKVNYITEVCTAKFVGKHEFSYLDAINYLKKLNL